MTDTANPLAPHHLPWFITAPGGTDYLFIGMTVLIIVALLGIGNLYFQLHALPERRAHRANVFQMEIVAVLALLALFTHQHIFWIAALLLALIEFPDFTTPINSIAQSLEKLAQRVRPAAPELEGSAAPALGEPLRIPDERTAKPPPEADPPPAAEGREHA